MNRLRRLSAHLRPAAGGRAASSDPTPPDIPDPAWDPAVDGPAPENGRALNSPLGEQVQGYGLRGTHPIFDPRTQLEEAAEFYHQNGVRLSTPAAAGGQRGGGRAAPGGRWLGAGGRELEAAADSAVLSSSSSSPRSPWTRSPG